MKILIMLIIIICGLLVISSLISSLTFGYIYARQYESYRECYINIANMTNINFTLNDVENMTNDYHFIIVSQNIFYIDPQ